MTTLLPFAVRRDVTGLARARRELGARGARYDRLQTLRETVTGEVAREEQDQPHHGAVAATRVASAISTPSTHPPASREPLSPVVQVNTAAYRSPATVSSFPSAA